MKVWFYKHRHDIQRALFYIGLVVAAAVIVLGFITASINDIIVKNRVLQIWYLITVWLWCMLIVGYTLMKSYNRERDKLKVYSHNIAANLIDIFEEFLDEHDINIPDEEREGNEGEARIYGNTYDDLLYKTEISLIATLTCCENGCVVVPDVFE